MECCSCSIVKGALSEPFPEFHVLKASCLTEETLSRFHESKPSFPIVAACSRSVVSTAILAFQCKTDDLYDLAIWKQSQYSLYNEASTSPYIDEIHDKPFVRQNPENPEMQFKLKTSGLADTMLTDKLAGQVCVSSCHATCVILAFCPA